MAGIHLQFDQNGAKAIDEYREYERYALYSIKYFFKPRIISCHLLFLKKTTECTNCKQKNLQYF